MARRERQIPRPRRPRRHRASSQGRYLMRPDERSSMELSTCSLASSRRPSASPGERGSPRAARRLRCRTGRSAAIVSRHGGTAARAGAVRGYRPGRWCACSRSTAEQSTPQRPSFPAPEGFVFATSLPGNPVDVVLGVFGRRASWSCGRQMSEVWVLGACATFLTHARRYPLRKRCTSRSASVSPASAHLVARHLLARREGVEPPTF